MANTFFEKPLDAGGHETFQILLHLKFQNRRHKKQSQNANLGYFNPLALELDI